MKKKTPSKDINQWAFRLVEKATQPKRKVKKSAKKPVKKPVRKISIRITASGKGYTKRIHPPQL